MGALRAAALLLTLATLAAYLATSPIVLSGGAYLYLYGATWCPYCRALDEFLSKRYPGSYHFCKIDVSKSCEEAFRSIVNIVGSKVSPEHRGYLDSIPQTYVVVDGRYLVAVVIGAVADPGFWDNITSTKPSDRVLLVVPPKVYEIPMSLQEQGDLVSRYIATSATVTQQAPALDPRVLVPAALVAAGGALIAYSFIGRRR